MLGHNVTVVLPAAPPLNVPNPSSVELGDDIRPDVGHVLAIALLIGPYPPKFVPPLPADALTYAVYVTAPGGIQGFRIPPPPPALVVMCSVTMMLTFPPPSVLGAVAVPLHDKLR